MSSSSSNSDDYVYIRMPKRDFTQFKQVVVSSSDEAGALQTYLKENQKWVPLTTVDFLQDDPPLTSNNKRALVLGDDLHDEEHPAKKQKLITSMAEYSSIPRDVIEYIFSFSEYYQFNIRETLQPGWFNSVFVRYRDGSIGSFYPNLSMEFSIVAMLNRNWQLLLQYCRSLYAVCSKEQISDLGKRLWINAVQKNMSCLKKFESNQVLEIRHSLYQFLQALAARNIDTNLRIGFCDRYNAIAELKTLVRLEIFHYASTIHSGKLLAILLEMPCLKYLCLTDFLVHYSDFTYFLEHSRLTGFEVSGVDIEGVDKSDISRFDGLVHNTTIKNLVIWLADEKDIVCINQNHSIHELTVREIIEHEQIELLSDNQSIEILNLDMRKNQQINYAKFSTMKKLRRLQIHINALNETLYTLIRTSTTLKEIYITAHDLNYSILERYRAICKFMSLSNRLIICKLVGKNMETFDLIGIT